MKKLDEWKFNRGKGQEPWKKEEWKKKYEKKKEKKVLGSKYAKQKVKIEKSFLSKLWQLSALMMS